MTPQLPLLDICIVVIYLVAVVGFGLYKSRGVSTIDNFLVANRSLGLWVLIGTLVMTEFNPSTLVWMTGLGYLGGPYALSLTGFFIVGLGLYTLIVARRWKRLNVTSLAELFELRYNRSLRLLAAAMMLFALSYFSVGYLKATSAIFSTALGLPETPVMVALCLTVLAVTLFGGLTSVAWTDLFSFIVTAVTLPILFFFAWTNSGGLDGLRAAYPAKYLSFDPIGMWNDEAVPFRLIFTLYLLIMWVYLLAPWYAQRMFAARDERVAHRSMAWSTLLVTVLYAMVMLVGCFYFATNPTLTGEAQADRALGLAIHKWMTPGLRGLMLAAIFAICQTTMSSIWNTHIAMSVQDFYAGVFRREAGDAERLRAAQILTFLLAAFTLVVALSLDAAVRHINFLGNIFFASLFFAGIGGFLWRKIGARAAWFSILVTNAAGVLLYLSGDAKWDFYFYVFAVPGIAFLSALVALFENRSAEQNARIDEFYARVGQPWFGANQRNSST
jgi:Na+/proline symporter